MDKSKQVILEFFKTKAAAMRALGINRQAFDSWDKVPPNRAIDFERATGKKLTRRKIRPDFFE